MFVCPTVSELYFYGCWHPCLLYYLSVTLFYNLGILAIAKKMGGKSATTVFTQSRQISSKNFCLIKKYSAYSWNCFTDLFGRFSDLAGQTSAASLAYTIHKYYQKISYVIDSLMIFFPHFFKSFFILVVVL